MKRFSGVNLTDFLFSFLRFSLLRFLAKLTYSIYESYYFRMALADFSVAISSRSNIRLTGLDVHLDKKQKGRDLISAHHVLDHRPRGKSREYVLRIPMRVVKGDLNGAP